MSNTIAPVRILEQRTITADGKMFIEAYGTSENDKPTGNWVTGSRFIEIDTSKIYFWDESTEQWWPWGEEEEGE